MFPTKAAIGALTAIGAGAVLVGAIDPVPGPKDFTLGPGQIVPGIDARLNEETIVGVKALAVSVLTGAAVLYFGNVKKPDGAGRGIAYAAGLGAILGLGMIMHGQKAANVSALQGSR